MDKRRHIVCMGLILDAGWDRIMKLDTRTRTYSVPGFQHVGHGLLALRSILVERGDGGRQSPW